MIVEFKKMSGAGNDFIVLDNRSGEYNHLDIDIIRNLCRRRTGIGADGLIMINDDTETDFFMRYYNSDGGEAEMCANGARCAVLFYKSKYPERGEFFFRSPAGSHEGRIVKSAGEISVEIEMPEPTQIETACILELDEMNLNYGFVIIGVPHVVILCKDNVNTAQVFELGSKIRYHDRFKPAGTNVNFVRTISREIIEVRTYERGVEGETLACGTGVTASSILTTLWDLTEPPVTSLTRGGEDLSIDFEYSSKPGEQIIKSVRLQGGAEVIYEGRLNL
jgi:diaminopimelate epimerase